LSIVLSGRALHAGGETAVAFDRIDGPIQIVQNGHTALLSDLLLDRTDAGVVLTDGGAIRVDLVEHLLSAFGGTGVRSGVRAEIRGPELPLLDGGSGAYVRALDRLGLLDMVADLGQRAETEIRGRAEIREGKSTYRFDPGPSVRIEIEIDFDHPAIGRQRTRWEGDVASYVSRIAPARSFGLAADLSRLVAASRARGAEQRHPDVLAALIVFDDTAVVPTGPRAEPDEPARHKLLDLVGDLFVHGGPPAGALFASRPGHGVTHDVMRKALDRGIVARRCGNRS
jgi:UDP-3-O-[3-hydroxymyristoyl] N-acetylglucosamine deacetylase